MKLIKTRAMLHEFIEIYLGMFERGVEILGLGGWKVYDWKI